MMIWKKNCHPETLIQNYMQKNLRNILVWGEIISIAREFIKFNAEKIDLNQIIKDKNSDKEMIELGRKRLRSFKKKRNRTW